MKSKLFLLLILFTNSFIAQILIEGEVNDSVLKQSVPNVLVQHKESNTWVYTNENGVFNIEVPNLTEVELYFSHLAYADKAVKIKANKINNIIIYLEEQNLRIKEVNLIGKNNKHSEIVLKAEAIDNVQSFTALEVLEQLPGQSTSETTLNGYKNILFRTAEIGLSASDAREPVESHGNKSFGTAIVVNDIPISNNENMQSWAPNSSGVFQRSNNQFSADNFGDYTSTTYSNAGLGVDLREIPTENIDEIEIVQGIPEAKYGDLTSGLIKIKTKAGITPFVSSISFRDGSTQVNASKGFKISDKWGVLNIGGSYLNSKPDPKEVLDEYNRINVNTQWSLFNQKTKNTLSLALFSSLDDGKQDPDDISESYVKNESRGFTLSNQFTHKIDKWVNEISLNTSINYKKQYTARRELINNGGEVIPVGLENGITEGLYTPVTYYAQQEIEGKPISGFADLQFFKSFSSSKKWLHKVTAGLTVRYSDNIGKGRIGNPETADQNFTLDGSGSGIKGFRPYSFNDNLRPELQLAGYLQDNIIKQWDNNSLSIAAGLRLDNQNSYNVLSPRLNTYFKRNSFKVRGGIGLASKAPSLNSLYTGKQYFDLVIGDFRTNTYNVAYIQTFVKEAQNLDLEPTKSLNTEFGFDYKLWDSEISITGFYKKLWDGLISEPVFNTIISDDYEVVNNDPLAPTIEITGERLYTYEDLNTINGLTSIDYGVEFLCKIGKIESLNIDASVNALYVKTKTNDASNIYTNSNTVSEESLIGVFEKSPTNIQELFRIGTSINYHISKVGLLLNFRTEHFISEKSSNENNDIHPIGYYDQEYNYFDIPTADRTNEQLYGHLFRNVTTNIIEDKNVAHNLHFRLSKDFTNGYRVDFYATNFLNLKPTYTNTNGDEVIWENFTSLAFGMKLNYKF